MSALPAGRHFFRGDDGYEAARRGTVWHQRVPERYPEVIVQAVDADDIIAGLRYAKANGHQGQHRFGWAQLRGQPSARRRRAARRQPPRPRHDRRREGLAVAGPGKGGSLLMADLEAQNLFFPGGHCKGVCLGGYLLQGGYGWNSRDLRPGVRERHRPRRHHRRRRADPLRRRQSRRSLLGRARCRPGLFRRRHVVLPQAVSAAGRLWHQRVPLPVRSRRRGVTPGPARVGAEVDPRVEMQAVASRGEPDMGIDVPVISFASPAFADSEEEAEKALALFGTCPVADQALVKVPYMPTDLPTWYDVAMSHYLSDHHYAVDNMWTSAPAEDLLPGIRTILDTMPPHPAHFLWLNWGPSPPRQDMAYSIEDDIYLALYGSWKDPRRRRRSTATGRGPTWPRCRTWPVGIQLADENLGQRPARFATDAAMAKLDRVRAEYDPDGLFNSWMGRI